MNIELKITLLEAVVLTAVLLGLGLLIRQLWDGSRRSEVADGLRIIAAYDERAKSWLDRQQAVADAAAGRWQKAQEYLQHRHAAGMPVDALDAAFARYMGQQPRPPWHRRPASRTTWASTPTRLLPAIAEAAL